jgi:7-carboxy-7-deazaguanine synthase
MFHLKIPLETQLTARLVEVFSAIQGEGLNVGTRQLFIRFALCDLRCHFCDSAHTWSAPSHCRIERTPGRRDFETYPNPVQGRLLLEWVERLNQPNLHDSITLEFLPLLRQLSQLPIYLETGGHRPDQLTLVLPYIDSVGMDIKLKSVSGEDRWQAHSKFLQLCHQASVEVFVKLIVDRHTDPAELEQAAQLVADVSPKIPVFLQPMTPLEESNRLLYPPSPEQILAWQALMKQTLASVRVVPQTHKMIGQL